MMRTLYFTPGSPFSRGVRIVLHEKNLPFERAETISTPSVEERARVTPTLQVPTLVDGAATLWDSVVILDYLMANYPTPAAPDGHLPFASEFYRPEAQWRDKLALATVQTFGETATTIGQMRWSGVKHENNSFLGRGAARIDHLLEWFEGQLESGDDGFLPGVVSVQDVLLVAHMQYVQMRPLGLELGLEHRPKLSALHQRLRRRPSFIAHPMLFWEPGVTGYTDAGEPIRG